MVMAMSRIQPFSWYGSKYNWLNEILPKLPPHDHYRELFGGSGTVLLNRTVVSHETYNDADGRILAFWRALKDSRDDLLETLNTRYGIYHEQAFQDAGEVLADGSSDHVERGAAFFIRAIMAYNADLHGGFAMAPTEIRTGKPQHVSRFQYKLDHLNAVADRIQNVQFACGDALELIQRFDREDTIIYLDPPYPRGTREDSSDAPDRYSLEMDDECHRELASVVRDSSADIAISSYRGGLYDDLFDDWNRYELAEKGTASSNTDTSRIESLYTNYTVPEGGFPSPGEVSADGGSTDLTEFGGDGDD